MSREHFKVKKGLLIQSVIAYPGDPEEGDIILRSDLTPPRLEIYRNNTWNTISDSGFQRLQLVEDADSLGTNAVLPLPSYPFLKLANPGLISVNGITAGQDGQVLVVTNTTGNVVLFYDQVGAGGYKIITGTNKPLKIKNGGTLLLVYDGSEAGWRTVGGAGSEASGNEILETIKNHFIDATFDLVTPYIVKTEEALLLDVASTAVYSSADDSINFSSAGKILATVQLADASEFLTTTNPLGQVELMAFWKKDSVDTAATYEVSRNGGNEYQVVSMERVGSTEVFRGIHRFVEEAASETLLSQITNDSSQDLDATNQQLLSQPFSVITGSKFLLKEIVLNITKTGSPAGNLYVSICSDSSGDPDSVLAETPAIPASTLSTGNNTIDFPDLYLAAGTYHLRIRSDATYKASYSAGVTEISLSVNTSGASPYLRKNNGTVWSPSLTDNLVYTLKGLKIDLRVRITSSMAAKLEGLALFYDKSVGNIATGTMQREVVHFKGSANQNSFTITNFVPHPDLLKVYDVKTGKVYVFGTFSVEGQNIVFDAGKFNQPGENLTLVFDQTAGGAFDNSDSNGQLLSENRLGSKSGTLDKSLAGQGLLLRADNGTLVECWVHWNGTSYELQFNEGP